MKKRKSSSIIVANTLVQVVREINPTFADVDHGVYKQQDADECLSLLLNNIRYTLETKGNIDEIYSIFLVDELT